MSEMLMSDAGGLPASLAGRHERALELCDDRARDWGARANRYRRRFRQYKYLTVTLAVTVTVLSGIEGVPGWIVTACSGLVALFTGLLAATQSQDLWVHSRWIQSRLYGERFLYLQGAGPYAEVADDEEEKVQLFSQRIEDVLMEGHDGWARSVQEI